MAGYSDEQLRRKAHLENGGTIYNYDRSHYIQDMNKKLEGNTNETNNN